MSHVSDDKKFASDVAAVLERATFACFVAHEEIEPTVSWCRAIESGLDTCDVLVAFVTPKFRQSDWCDQEVGWAMGRGAIVVPVNLGANPHGFFGQYQALLAQRTEPQRTALAIAGSIATAVFRNQRPMSARLVAPMAAAVVAAFCGSPSFDATRRRLGLLRKIPTDAWTPDLQQKVLEACETNLQIAHAQLADGSKLRVPDVVESLLGSAATT